MPPNLHQLGLSLVRLPEIWPPNGLARVSDANGPRELSELDLPATPLASLQSSTSEHVFAPPFTRRKKVSGRLKNSRAENALVVPPASRFTLRANLVVALIGASGLQSACATDSGIDAATPAGGSGESAAGKGGGSNVAGAGGASGGAAGGVAGTSNAGSSPGGGGGASAGTGGSGVGGSSGASPDGTPCGWEDQG